MRTYWICLGCVAGSTENKASTLAQQHTQRTKHPTMGTTDRALWLRKMQLTSTARGEGE